VLDAVIPISSKITLLGVTLDSCLTFEQHCSSVVRSCLYHLRSIRHIRPILSDDDAKLLSACFIQSRLDSCNSLLYNTSEYNLKRLQRIQNTCARLTLQQRLSANSNSLLQQLHWLPIRQRINFKIACLTRNSLCYSQPTYLRNVLSLYNPSRRLRSADHQLLFVPKTHLKMSDGSFTSAAPCVWNSLPVEIRQSFSLSIFRSALKTHLFNSAY